LVTLERLFLKLFQKSHIDLDFIPIQPHDIRKGHLHITPKKTKLSSQKQIIIPTSARFERVLKKYEDVLPNFDRNALTRFNTSSFFSLT
jgi:hypothetical protein